MRAAINNCYKLRLRATKNLKNQGPKICLNTWHTMYKLYTVKYEKRVVIAARFSLLEKKYAKHVTKSGIVKTIRTSSLEKGNLCNKFSVYFMIIENRAIDTELSIQRSVLFVQSFIRQEVSNTSQNSI